MLPEKWCSVTLFVLITYSFSLGSGWGLDVCVCDTEIKSSRGRQQLRVFMCISKNLGSAYFIVWWKKPKLPGCIKSTLPRCLPAWISVCFLLLTQTLPLPSLRQTKLDGHVLQNAQQNLIYTQFLSVFAVTKENANGSLQLCCGGHSKVCAKSLLFGTGPISRTMYTFYGARSICLHIMDLNHVTCCQELMVISCISVRAARKKTFLVLSKVKRTWLRDRICWQRLSRQVTRAVLVSWPRWKKVRHQSHQHLYRKLWVIIKLLLLIWWQTQRREHMVEGS